MDMGFTSIIAALLAARNRGDVKEDRQDAFVGALLPELAKYFAGLIKGAKDSDTFFSAANAFVLAAYSAAPDAMQFLIRYMASRAAERLQGLWPSWASLPLLILVQGYFNALEEATRDKPKPTNEDVKAALAALTAKAKDATSGLGALFAAAQQAAEGIHIPHFHIPNPFPHGGRMSSDPHAAKPPSGAASDPHGKKPFLERVGEVSATLEEGWRKIKFAANRAEDMAQVAANGIVVAICSVAVTLAVLAGVLLIGCEPIVVKGVITAFAMFWTFGPLVGLALWYWQYITTAAKAAEENQAPSADEVKTAAKAAKNQTPSNNKEVNPFEKPGNGFVIGAAATVTGAFVFGVSSVVVAVLCAFGAVAHFTWAYAWVGLISIGIAYFSWIFTDVVFDALKALIRAVVPDASEGIELKLKGRLTRGFALVGFVYCFIMLFAIIGGIVSYTAYDVEWIALGAVTALMGAFVQARSGSVPSVKPAEHIAETAGKFSIIDFVRARWLFFASPVIPLMLLAFNTVNPPTVTTDKGETINCLKYPETEGCTVDGELPSYADRVFAATHPQKKTEGLDAENSACTNDALRVMETQGWQEACSVINKEDKNASLMASCAQAKACVEERRAEARAANMDGESSLFPFSLWYLVGGVTTIILVFVIVGLFTPNEKKKEEEGPKKAGGH